MHILKFNEAGNFPAGDPAGSGPAIYGPYFNLPERPFTLTPNPRFVFLSHRQREALSSLRYGLTTPNGFTLLTGDAGCGKTTMLRVALTELADSESRCVLLSNPTLTRSEFYEYLSRALGLSAEAAVSKTRFLEELHVFLRERFSEGALTGLVIDEAQSLPDELLEEIRLLGNIETASTKLLNIVLAGQPELLRRLHQPSLHALRQRIALRCELKTFDLPETAAYIAGRLRIAGGSPQDIFTHEAVVAIYDVTGGLPRSINVLCENALVSGFAEQVKPVPVRIVRDVAREFEMQQLPSDAAEQIIRAESPPEGTEKPTEKSTRTLLGTVKRVKRRFSFFGMFCTLLLWGSIARAQVPASPPANPAAPVAAGMATVVPSDYVIGTEDVLGVVFWRDADMTGDVTVRPDGMITLPLIGDLRAVGLKPEGLRDAIVKAASKYLEDINVTVVVRQINSRKAFITGEVKTPSGHPLSGSLTVMQLIALAGGLTEYADGKNITIMRNENGKTQTFKFNYKDVSKGKNLGQNIQLMPGDTVVVP